MAAACEPPRTCLPDIGDPIKTASQPNVGPGSANHGQGVPGGRGLHSSRRAGSAPGLVAAPVPRVGCFPCLEACLRLSAELIPTCFSDPCPSCRMGSVSCLELAQSRQCSRWLGAPEGGSCLFSLVRQVRRKYLTDRWKG